MAVLSGFWGSEGSRWELLVVIGLLFGIVGGLDLRLKMIGFFLGVLSGFLNFQRLFHRFPHIF